MQISQRTKFVIDCEYNGKTHELISMAIVPLWSLKLDLADELKPFVEEEREFYEVISPLPSDLEPWVKDNVVPHLNKPGIPFQLFQEKLEAFFRTHHIQEIHYDWCDDIAYLNRALITGPGERIKFPTQALVHVHHTDIEYTSQTAHNALEDARAVASAIRRRILRLP